MTSAHRSLLRVDRCPFLRTTGSTARKRLTTRARHALDRSHAVARSSGRTQVDTEHQLLAMFDVDDAFAVAILSEWGVTKTAVESDLRRYEREATRASATTSLTQAARNVRDPAEAIAAELGHHYVGTEHLLLALYSPGGPGTTCPPVCTPTSPVRLNALYQLAAGSSSWHETRLLRGKPCEGRSPQAA